MKDKGLTVIPQEALRSSKLRSLDMSFNPISNLDSLDKLSDLREIRMTGTRVTTLDALDKNSKLERIYFQGTALREISPVFLALKNLKVLDLENNRIGEMKNLQMCTGLLHLNLSQCRISKVQGLTSLLALEYLNLSGNNIETIDNALKKCRNLLEVDLSDNRIVDLEGLSGLRKLSVLRLERNALTSLKSIPRLVDLEELYVSENSISDIGLIAANLLRVQIVDLRKNAIGSIEDLRSLSDVSTLEELVLSGNKCVEDRSYFEKMAELIPSLQYIDYVSISDPAPLSARGRPKTPSAYRPTTPRVGSGNVIVGKDAIPLIRPSSARDGGAKPVLPIADADDLAAAFKARLASIKKAVSTVPLVKRVDKDATKPIVNHDMDVVEGNSSPLSQYEREPFHRRRISAGDAGKNSSELKVDGTSESKFTETSLLIHATEVGTEESKVPNRICKKDEKRRSSNDTPSELEGGIASRNSERQDSVPLRKASVFSSKCSLIRSPILSKKKERTSTSPSQGGKSMSLNKTTSASESKHGSLFSLGSSIFEPNAARPVSRGRPILLGALANTLSASHTSDEVVPLPAVAVSSTCSPGQPPSPDDERRFRANVIDVQLGSASPSPVVSPSQYNTGPATDTPSSTEGNSPSNRAERLSVEYPDEDATYDGILYNRPMSAPKASIRKAPSKMEKSGYSRFKIPLRSGGVA
jgi:Leucine-rich repeat (LRR) protein